MRRLLTCLVLLAIPVAAHAQPVPETPRMVPPPPDEMALPSMIPHPGEAPLRRPPRWAQRTPLGRILLPVPPRDPVSRLSATADENRLAWSPAQSYFLTYSAPYQLGTDFHDLRVGNYRFGD